MLNKEQMMELLQDLLQDAVDDSNEYNEAKLSYDLNLLAGDDTGITLARLNKEHGGLTNADQ